MTNFFRRIFTNSEEQQKRMDDMPDNSLEDEFNLQNSLDEKLDFESDDNDKPDTLPVAPDLEIQTNNRPPPETIDMGVTRPLVQDTHLDPSGHIIFAQASDVGRVRNNNQDAVLSFFFGADSADELPDFGAFIVADGMGGHQEGEKASAIAARTVLTDIFHTIYTPMIDDHAMDSERVTITEALIQSAQKANRLVRQKVQDGGTTLTAVVILGDQAYFGHIGDSRAYLLNARGKLERITRDHSVVQRLIELGQLTVEEAETHEQSNVLYRAIGQSEEIELDIQRRRLPANSHILLCSDGLWGLMSEDDIVEIMTSSADPSEACQKLVQLANDNGGKDNITALIIKTSGQQS